MKPRLISLIILREQKCFPVTKLRWMSTDAFRQNHLRNFLTVQDFSIVDIILIRKQFCAYYMEKTFYTKEF